MTSELSARCRVPVTRKCCFCVPVRRGVIIFAYVNLVLSLLSLPLLVFLLVEQVAGAAPDAERAPPALQIPLSIASVLADTALTIMLLFAAHKKHRAALALYVWMGAALQVAGLLADLVYFDSRHYVQNIVYFIFLGLNVYQLYLVWCVSQRLRAPAVRYVVYRDAAADTPPAH